VRACVVATEILLRQEPGSTVRLESKSIPGARLAQLKDPALANTCAEVQNDECV
jgi:hypothetical protein